MGLFSKIVFFFMKLHNAVSTSFPGFLRGSAHILLWLYKPYIFFPFFPMTYYYSFASASEKATHAIEKEILFSVWYSEVILASECVEWRKKRVHYSAVASMRPTEALASVKFWRISPIIFILHKRSSDIFNASWYYKEFSNSVNILWKNYHIIDLKGLRTLTQIFFEQILIKTIGEVNVHPDYVACF